MQEQVNVEVVLPLEVEIINGTEHQKASCPYFQQMHPAGQLIQGVNQPIHLNEMINEVLLECDGIEKNVQVINHTSQTSSTLLRGGCLPFAAKYTSFHTLQTCISLGYRASQSRPTR